jgi:hypothetical protein
LECWFFRYQDLMSDDAEESGKTIPPARAAAAGKGPSGGQAATEADRRRAREAAKLRENLTRRKQQTRARRAGEADDTEGLPAAKMDESS